MPPQAFSARWRDSRHLLILLGLVCQGFSVEGGWLPVLYGGVWLLGLLWQREQRRLPPWCEEVLVGLALLAAYALGARFSNNRLVFVGNGLVLYQFFRLLGPVTVREQMYTIAVALLHLAVGSQVWVEPVFAGAVLAALVLVPRSLFALEASKFRQVATTHGLGPARAQFVLLGLLMVAIAFALPRSRMAATMTGAVLPPGGGPQRDEIDMAAGAAELDERLICRVEGEGVDYLKTLALDSFDGQTWTATPYIRRVVSVASRAPPANAQRRRVRVESIASLENRLPADGHVYDVLGNFGNLRVYVMESGALNLLARPRVKPDYEYWTVVEPVPMALSAKDRRRYVGRPQDEQERSFGAQPAPSAGVQALVRQAIGNESDPQRQAQRLVEHLRTNFRYDDGPATLDRLTPMDDFLLTEKAGHCERFASALAYLLRTLDIPARVAIGYVASEYNELAGFYNIRQKHGHAWTEAWFPNVGWVTLDATPYGGGIPRVPRHWFSTLSEWLEYNWYARVVEFSAGDQGQLYAFVGDQATRLAELVWAYLLPVLGGALALSLLWLAWPLLRRAWIRRQAPLRHERARREAQHFYGRMCRELARQHFTRAAHETPLEFLDELARAAHPALAEIRLITGEFCAVRYAERELAAPARLAIRDALASLARRRWARVRPQGIPERKSPD